LKKQIQRYAAVSSGVWAPLKKNERMSLIKNSLFKILIGLIFVVTPCVEGKEIIYFLQGHWGKIFDPECSQSMRQAGYDLEPMFRLRKMAEEAGYEFRVAERDAPCLTDLTHQPIQDFKYLIVFDVFPHQIQYLAQYPKEKLILFLWEPPSVMPQSYDPENHKHFSRVYTWHDGLVDNKKYFKNYYPVLHPMASEAKDFNAKKFSTLIASNMQSSTPNELYSERFKLVEFFEADHKEDFDLYGRWWPGTFTTYRGVIQSKLDLLKNYKFCFAYENIKGVPGYITEKIFDCFEAGCVPVYWGAPNISKYVPKNCFIDREDFASNEALYTFMKNMDEAHYREYIKNIQTFLNSEQAQVFSFDNFVRNTMALIESSPPKD